MKPRNRIGSLILSVLATFLMSFFVMAQDQAPTPQADPLPAQSEPSKSTDTAGDEMPATASPLALVALMGVGSLGAGMVAHRYSKRFSAK